MNYRKMNVLVAVNENYLEPLSVMLYSLACHNRVEIFVYILHFDISLHAQVKFREKVINWEKRLIKIRFIQAEKDDFAEIGADPRYRQEANLRLQMQKLLPENVSRILWLDADIIVNGNIQSFYEYPDKGQYAIVCEDMFPDNEKRDVLRRIGMRQNERYFNSGVMLLYLNNIREAFEETYFLSVLKKNFHRMIYPDQSVLNICLKHHLVWCSSEIYNLQLLRLDGSSNGRRKIKAAKILHYNTKEKPWNRNYDGIAKMQYWRYCFHSLGMRRCMERFWKTM